MYACGVEVVKYLLDNSFNVMSLDDAKRKTLVGCPPRRLASLLSRARLSVCGHSFGILKKVEKNSCGFVNSGA